MSAPHVFLPRNRRPVPTPTRLVTRRVPAVVYAAVSVLLAVLVVGGAMASGWWSTAGHGGVTLTSGGTGTESGSDAGVLDAPSGPADVKGSMTVRQVTDAFAAVTTAEILTAFGAPAGTPATAQLKSLVDEGGDGMDIPAFRAWLEQRLAR